MEIVKIWLKSFIPHNYALAEVVKGTGKHSGKTMIHIPTPIKSSFLTDQRGFSADIDAPARMHSEIEIDLTNPRIRNEVQKCYATTEVDPDTGEELCHGYGKTDRMHFSPLDVNGKVLSVLLKASSSNPCIRMAAIDLAPRQDYFGTLTLNQHKQGLTVIFEGKVEKFPAYEMYVVVNGGVPHVLFQLSPEEGATVLNLIGAPGREVYHSVEIPL